MFYPKLTHNYSLDVFNSNFRELKGDTETLKDSLQAETDRARLAETVNADRITEEHDRAAARESIIENNFAAEARAIRALIDTAYANSNGYTDTKIAELIGGAPSTLDTLKEIADALTDSETVVQALNEAIGSKAAQGELDLHTGNVDIHVTVADKQNWNAPEFTQAKIRENINSGEAPPTLWGKVKKWFADLKTVAFTGSYNDLTDKPSIPDSYDFTLPAATATTRGGVKIGYSQNGKNYPVETQNEQMFVNVPWTDTDTTYSASSTTPKAAGTAAAGTETAYARGDHVHPLQTSVTGSSGSCTGNAATATKATADGNGANIANTYEKKAVVLTGTLAANATSIAFTNAAITTSATIDIYTGVYGVSPTAAAISGNELTLTFNANAAAMNVKIRILPT